MPIVFISGMQRGSLSFAIWQRDRLL